MANRFSAYWFFGAIVFFCLGGLFTYNLAELYFNGYIADLKFEVMPFDIRLLWLAVVGCIVMCVVCLSFSQPLELLNYVSRLERENRAMRKALECYDNDCELAHSRGLAKRLLDKNGRLGDAKIHYIEERREEG